MKPGVLKPGSLKPVIEHYRRLRDDTVAAQARVQLDLGAAQRTLQTLEQYREEQLQRARECLRNPMATSHLLLQTRFSGKLDEAIALQSQRVAELEQRIRSCRAEVLNHQQRLKAVESVEHRRLANARSRAQRADQFATDERASNCHAQAARQAAAETDEQPLRDQSLRDQPPPTAVP